MSLEFSHTTLGQKVLFGADKSAECLAAEVQQLEARRPMVIAAAQERELAERVTADIDVAVWHDDVVMHVPVEVAERARAVAKASDADLLISVGGGSTTGLAKAVALTSGLPIVAVPTTFAGSEATNVWGMTQDRRKTTGKDDRVLPGSVIYDAGLTATLPVDMAVASGLNALAHCVNSMWAPKTDPINQALALEGCRALVGGLPQLGKDQADIRGREKMQYGAYLAAVSFASAGSGLHHKICHVLGGTYDLPHAQTHAVVLPHVLAFNAPYAPEAEARLANAMGVTSAIRGLSRLYDDIDAPSALADYGMAAENIPEAAGLVAAVVPETNPRAASKKELEHLLEAMCSGDRSAWQ